MGKLRGVFCLISCIFIVGCASTSTMVMPEFKSTDTVLIGELQQKTLGEPMIVKMDLYFYPGFIAETNYTPPNYIGFQLPTINRASRWRCPQKLKNGNYRCKPTAGWGVIRGLGSPMDSTRYNLVISPSGQFIGYVVDPWNTATPYAEQPKIFRLTEIAQPGSFKQELIYNGKSKDTLKITYREFKDNLARSAFTQDLTYDMTESNEIGFRGMIIEVVEATNSFIKFIVRKPMTM